MKKIMIVTSIVLLAIGLTAMPALAYTNLGGAVTITATGTLSGDTKTFVAQVVNQGTDGTPGTSITFSSPSGLTDSGKALRITGGTNEIDARIIIYTDNASQFNPTTPEINPATGADGGGLVGQANKAYAAAMFWGVKSGGDLQPNENVDYGFADPAAPVEGGSGNSVYIVDKRHTASFTTANTALDNNDLYQLDGTLVVNVDNDGLYPQGWNYDLYDKINTDPSRVVVSQALYKNIATIAFGVQVGGSLDPENYICSVPKLITVSNSGDNVKARLLKTGLTGSDAYLYICIGADFRGLPAQQYSTTALVVEMVKG